MSSSNRPKKTLESLNPRPGPVRQTQGLAGKRSVSPHVRRLSEALDCECLGLLRSPARTMKQNVALTTTHHECPHMAIKTQVHTLNGDPMVSVRQPVPPTEDEKPGSKENSQPSASSSSPISSTPSPPAQTKPK